MRRSSQIRYPLQGTQRQGPHVFVPRDAVQGTRVIVQDPQELHHVRHVLRMAPGDPIECLDGTGVRYIGHVIQCTSRQLMVDIAERTVQETMRLRVVLAQALLKADRLDWVVQKATELGVTRFVPLMTEHTVVRPDADHRERKVVRWQRIAKEAAQQCGRTTLPVIEMPQPFDQVLPALAHHACVLMPTLSAPAKVLKGVLEEHPKRDTVVVLIGPEGDFTQDEARRAQAQGAHLVSLGPLTLRAETAAIATLAILQYVWGMARPQSPLRARRRAPVHG